MWLENLNIPLIDFSGTTFATGDVNLNDMFKTVGPIMLLEAQGFHALNNLTASDAGEIYQDFDYMLNKGTQSADNETVHAIPK
jgi:hypothetical protein